MTRNALGRGLGALIREPEELTGARPGQGTAAPGEDAAGQDTEGEASAGGAGPSAATRRGREPVQAGGPLATTVASNVAASLAGQGHGGNLSGLQQIDIDLIAPSPYQPRTNFGEEGIAELARSIQMSGIIQPLVVRPMGKCFQLIAGERRWRAAQRAGMMSVPAIVRDVPDATAMEFTLIENLQREDLNPIEEARAFDRLMSEFGFTQEEVAARTGKERATISNALRLLGLETTCQQLVQEGKLSGGAGRALLAVADLGFRRRMALRAARGGLTVRQIEKLAARQARRARDGSANKRGGAEHDANTRGALEELQRHLGTRVTLVPRSGKRAGQLIIEYYDEQQLMGLYDQLSRR